MGTTVGAASDANGEYTLDVPSLQDTLRFSYVGFQTQDVPVQGRTQVDVALRSEALQADEVVVVGYGTQSQDDVTGAISSVSGEELNEYQANSIGEGLQGRVPGVTVRSTSTPGDQGNILIRGISTINGNDPLYVVDGVTVEDIAFLSPDNIKSIDVLKDASSTAIYGSRASNGVVLITTRDGQQGEPQISAKVNYGTTSAAEQPDLASASEYARIANEAARNAGQEPAYGDPSELASTNWWEAITQQGYNRQASLGVSGGTEQITYSTNVNYTGEEGLIQGSDFQRLNAHLKSEYTPTERLSVQQSLNLSRWNQTLAATGVSSAMLIDPTTSIRVDRGTGSQYDNYGASPTDVWNPVAQIERQDDDRKQFYAMGSLSAEYEILEHLTAKSQFGLDYQTWERDLFSPNFTIDVNERNLVNSVQRERNVDLNWSSNNTLTYDRGFGVHDLTVLSGVILEAFDSETSGAYGEAVPSNNPSLRQPAAATENYNVWGNDYQSSLLSFLGRVNYGFDDTYRVTLAFRADGSSNFTEGNRWGYFPSVSASWTPTNMDFMENVSFINTLKVRGGWGRVGNQSIPSLATTATIGRPRYVTGSGREIRLGAQPSSFPNSDLQWETVEDWNVGVDASLWENRLSGSFEFFDRTTRDMLMQQSVVATAGYEYASPWTNVGRFSAQGIEATLQYNHYFGEEAQLSIGGNLTRTTNQIEELANGDAIASGYNNIFGRITRSEEGGIAGGFYGYETNGLFQTGDEVSSYVGEGGSLIQPNAQPGDIRFVDQDGDGQITAEDRTYIGDPTPDFSYGINLDFTYKGFDLSALFQGTVGNDIVNLMRAWNYSGTYNYNKVEGLLEEAWDGEGSTNEVPRLTANDDNQNFNRFSDFFVEDGTYLRLRNLQVGYELPSALLSGIGGQRVRVFAGAQNLLTLTGYDGINPEVGSYGDAEAGGGEGGYVLRRGIDGGQYPVARTFTVGLDVVF